MHRLRSITIRNLKSIKDETFPLDDFTPLIGYNNAGKTNILLGIKWLLHPHRLDSNSFNSQDRAVEVFGTFSGLSKRLLEQLPAEEGEALGAFVNNNEVHLLRRQQDPNDGLNQIELCIRNQYFQDPAQEWIPIPTAAMWGIYRLFPKPIYINSLDNPFDEDLRNPTLTVVGKLIGEIIKPLEQRYHVQLSTTLKKLNSIFSADGWDRAPELLEFDSQCNANLEPLFPSMRVKLHVPSPKLSEIFKTGTLHVFESDEANPADVSTMGTGARRTIQMALIRQLAEVRKANIHHHSRRLLLIDSPELYLHPQAVELVRVSLKKLSKEGYQVIFATHSAQMVTSEDVGTSLLIRKTPGRGTFKRQRIEDAIKQVITDAPSQLQMLFSLSNSNELLFADNVLLTEGKTELRILPHIFEMVTNESFALIKCALIRQGGVSNTKKSIQVLSAMDLPTRAIVDLDYAFTSAVGHHFLKKKDPDLHILQEILAEFAKQKDIRLINGLPVNRNSAMPAAQAYAQLASNSEARPYIHNLHRKLLKHNIWLWTRGAIEEHLGIQGKNEQAWSEFITRVRTEDIKNVIPDYRGVVKLCEWIKKR
jgi:putative ATP-dependent endonuclease of the OLD family